MYRQQKSNLTIVKLLSRDAFKTHRPMPSAICHGLVSVRMSVRDTILNNIMYHISNL